MRRIAALLDGINFMAGFAAGMMLLAMVLMVAREAIGRYFFNAPTDWVVELAGYFLVGIVFLSGGYILRENAHIRVDIFYDRFLRRNRLLVDLVSYAMAAPFLALLIWQGADLAAQAFQSGEKSMIMRWPLWLPEVLVPLGAGLLLLQCLV